MSELSRRQEILFTETADLFEAIVELDPTTKRPVERTFPPRFRDVACYMVPRDDVTGPATVIRLAGDNMFTHDEWHFAEGQELGENWRIRKKSVNADGVPVVDWGEVWLVAGQPKREIKLGMRDAGNTVVQATREIRPPRELDFS